MNKTEKGIIGLSAALVVLGGGLFALNKLAGDDGSSSSSLSDTEPTTEAEGAGLTLIYDPTLEGPDSTEHVHGVIKSVTVNNENGTLTANLSKAATAESTAEYALAGYEDIPLNSTSVSSLANRAAGLTTTALIEKDSADVSRFGLTDPRATVEVTFETGSKKTLLIGDEAPADAQTYVMVEGINSVYTVSTSSLSCYEYSLFDLVDKQLVVNYAAGDYPVVNSLKIERTDKPDIVIMNEDEIEATSSSSAVHIMTEPMFAQLAVERSTPVTHGMFGLTGEEVYAVRPTAEELEAAGLSDPYCRVTLVAEENTYVLLLSEMKTDEDGSKYAYGMLEDGLVVCRMKADDVPWITIEPIDIASRNNIITVGVWHVDSLTAELADGTKADFVVTAKNADVDRTEATVGASDFTTTLNGAAYDTERYRQFYSFLVYSVAAEELVTGVEPSGSPLATITLHDATADKSTKIEFYEKGTLTAYAAIDGEIRFTCPTAMLDALKQNMALLNTDEEFINEA